jgi:calcineurin-like phosphoesterase family protein
MRVWFTADPHFGHGNIIRYCHRPFLSDEEKRLLEELGQRGKWRVSDETVRRHDEALLSAINERVAANDLLYIVGDFCMGTLYEAAGYRGRIACKNVFLVWGNHDHRSIAPLFSDAFEQGMVEVAGQAIWLNHYPMRSWNRSFHGSWHLYGHVHGRLAWQDTGELDWMLTRDVGVDACGYAPMSFEELSAFMAPRAEKFQARREKMVSGGGEDVV